jgi:hypothetical protein
LKRRQLQQQIDVVVFHLFQNVLPNPLGQIRSNHQICFRVHSRLKHQCLGAIVHFLKVEVERVEFLSSRRVILSKSFVHNARPRAFHPRKVLAA